MKEETKKKLCKISKIVGFAITFGFAVFGVLCAAMLMANGSGAKDEIKTLDSSLVQNEVRSERNIKPRKAPNFGDSPNLFASANSYEYSFAYPTYATSGTNLYRTTYVLTLQPGTYYFNDGEWYSYLLKTDQSFSTISSFFEGLQRLDNLTQTYYDLSWNVESVLFGTGVSSYFYVDSPTVYFASGYSGGLVLYLVDTMDIPATSVLILPNNWSPFALITDQVTDDNRFGLLNLGSPTSGTLVGPDIELTNIVFRYRGVVYDKIGFSFNDASHSTGYVRSDGTIFDPLGQYVVQNVDTHVMSLNYIAFGQSWTNRYDKVVGARYSDKALPESPVDGVMWYPALGQYYWVNGGAPTIEIIELKSETPSGRYDNRYSNLNDLQLLELLSNYSASTLDIGDTGMVFDLMTIAFNSLTPILSIYILPGLTLGMILFIPLIGGIIVIIIKVIKK